MDGNEMGVAGAEVGRERRPECHRLVNVIAVEAPPIAESDLRSRVLSPAPGLPALVGDVDVDRLLHTRSHRSRQCRDRDPSLVQRGGVWSAWPGPVDIVRGRVGERCPLLPGGCRAASYDRIDYGVVLAGHDRHRHVRHQFRNVQSLVVGAAADSHPWARELIGDRFESPPFDGVQGGVEVPQRRVDEEPRAVSDDRSVEDVRELHESIVCEEEP